MPTNPTPEQLIAEVRQALAAYDAAVERANGAYGDSRGVHYQRTVNASWRRTYHSSLDDLRVLTDALTAALEERDEAQRVRFGIPPIPDKLTLVEGMTALREAYLREILRANNVEQELHAALERIKELEAELSKR
jgi:hypothetical protein